MLFDYTYSIVLVTAFVIGVHLGALSWFLYGREKYRFLGNGADFSKSNTLLPRLIVITLEVLFLGATCLGVLFLGATFLIHQELSFSAKIALLRKYLFGNPTAALNRDFYLILASALLTSVALLYWLYWYKRANSRKNALSSSSGSGSGSGSPVTFLAYFLIYLGASLSAGLGIQHLGIISTLLLALAPGNIAGMLFTKKSWVFFFALALGGLYGLTAAGVEVFHFKGTLGIALPLIASAIFLLAIFVNQIKKKQKFH